MQSAGTALRSALKANVEGTLERIAERHDIVNYSGSNMVAVLKEIMKLTGVRKVPEAAQLADPKPAVQETTGKERDNGALAGSLTELLDETPGLEPGQGQNEQEEPQGPEPPTVQ